MLATLAENNNEFTRYLHINARESLRNINSVVFDFY